MLNYGQTCPVLGGEDQADLYRPFIPELSIPMTKALQPLKDKIALVVGGSRGIGAGIARRLAKDGAGIALTYAAAADKANELVQQITAGGGRVIAIKADSGMRPNCATPWRKPCSSSVASTSSWSMPAC